MNSNFEDSICSQNDPLIFLFKQNLKFPILSLMICSHHQSLPFYFLFPFFFEDKSCSENDVCSDLMVLFVAVVLDQILVSIAWKQWRVLCLLQTVWIIGGGSIGMANSRGRGVTESGRGYHRRNLCLGL